MGAHAAAAWVGCGRSGCSAPLTHVGTALPADTAGLGGPKVALVSTLASVDPAPPYLFRTYQLPPGSEGLAADICGHAGSCKHPVWQAVRASSAASFYLEDFRWALGWVGGWCLDGHAATPAACVLLCRCTPQNRPPCTAPAPPLLLTPPSCGGDKFQDGAVTANNPAVIALQEARLLWPDHPVDVMLSLGVGTSPPVRRASGLSSFMETGSILIESRWGGWVWGRGGAEQAGWAAWRPCGARLELCLLRPPHLSPGCSTNVTRAQEALATLMPLVPGVKYFR